MEKVDVAIIGAGPAGLFAAYELSEKTKLSTLVLEKGRAVFQRNCPMGIIGAAIGECTHCKPCNILSGVGGAGGLSSCILNLRPDIGGNLEELTKNERKAWELVKKVDEIFLKHGAPNELYVPSDETLELSRKAASVGVKFIQIPQRLIGSDYTVKVIESIQNTLEKRGVKILPETKVEDFGKGFVKTANKEIKCKYIIAATGRVGADWLLEKASSLGVKFYHGPIDIGVRVEVPNIVMEPVIKINRDPKFHIFTRTYDDFVRTFCTNWSGFVVREMYDGFVGVNGHSLRDVKSPNTNFAFLTRVNLTEPVEDTTAYGRSIAELATTIGGGKPILQRLGDLRNGRRSYWDRIKRSGIEPTLRVVTPGDIAMALPHRVVTNIIEGLEKLDAVVPGVASDTVLLYAPEIKFYAMRVEVGKNFETNVENLFVAGDGVGLSRGIVGAAATGILAAEGIMKKEGLI